jgi:AraC-like DNA-binding protein
MPQLAAYFSMTPQQLRTELTSGKSLDQVAQEHSISPTTLQTEVQSLVHSNLQDRVSAGHMTQTRETKLEQSVDAQLPKVLANTHLIAKPMEFKAHMYFLNKVAQDLHMTRTQLVTDLKGGQSMAQVAQAQGMSASQLTSDLQQAIDQQMNKRVDTLVNKTDWFQKSNLAQASPSASSASTPVAGT